MTGRSGALPAARPAVEGRWPAGVAHVGLPTLFLLYAVPAVLFLAVAMAPFQVADELAHALRADHISHGRIISKHLGGLVDGGLAAYGDLYKSMWFHPEVKQLPALARQGGAIGWLQPARYENFQNSAQYGPLLYLPQALGIGLGRIAGLSVAWTLVLARIVNGLAACATGFLALSINRRGTALTFTTLLLPMTLSQFASVSQDAQLIALSILAGALASRVMAENRPAGAGEFALFALIVVATTLARPSQIALVALTPALTGRGDPGWRLKALMGGAAILPIAIWFYLLRTLMPPVPSDWSVSGQFHHILAEPLALPTAMVNSVVSQFDWLLGTVVGRLGWLDAPMPHWYYLAAAVAFACGLIAPGNSGATLRPALIADLTFVLLFTALCGALYLSWTPVGKATIDGLQGRYILPVLPLLGWLMPACGRRFERLLRPAWYAVLLFPLVSLATLPGVIMERYYGSWPVMAESLEALLVPP